MANPVATALINGKHVEVYTYDQLGAGLPITLTGSSTFGDGSSIAAWEWSIVTSDANIEGGIPETSGVDVGVNGDFTNGKATVQNPTITLDVAGGYCFSLRAQNDIGQWSLPADDKDGGYQAIVYILTESGTKLPPANQKRYHDDLNQGLARLETLAVGGSAAGFVSKILDTGGSTGSTTSSTFVAASGASGTFAAPASGSYYFVAMLNMYHLYGSDNRTAARFRLNFDGGTTIVGEDDQTYDVDVIPSGWRNRRTFMFGPVELTQGNHPFTVDWKRSHADIGSPSINYDGNEPWTLFAIQSAGSGAGGAITSSDVLAAGLVVNTSTPTPAGAGDPFVATSGNFQDNHIDSGLSVTINTSTNETVDVEFNGTISQETADNGSFYWYLDVDGSPQGETRFMSIIAGRSKVITLKEKVTLSAGAHTLKIRVANDTGDNTTLQFGARLDVTQYRGGLVPVEADGTLVTALPKALNFVGASVTDTDGTANISLPTAVTAEGVLLEAGTVNYPVGDTIASSTFATIGSGGEAASFTLVVPNTALYELTLFQTFNIATPASNEFDFRVNVDSGAQYVGAATSGTTTKATPDDWAWRARTGGSTDRIFLRLTATVQLTAGSHTFTVEWARHSGASSGVVNQYDRTNVFLEPITGSGAGGEIQNVTTMPAGNSDPVTTVVPTFTPIQQSSVNVLELIVTVSEGEELAITVEGQMRSDTSTASSSAVQIHDGTSVVGVPHYTSSESNNQLADAYSTVSFTRFTGPLAAGTYTFTVQGAKAHASNPSWLFNNAQVFCRQMRGGLVPVRQDGVDVIDKPQAFDFVNAQVTNVGGVAKVNLLGASGVDAGAEQTLVGNFDHSGDSTWKNIDNGGGDAFLQTVTVEEGEVVLLAPTVVHEVQSSPGGLLTTSFRFSIDSGAQFIGDYARDVSGTTGAKSTWDPLYPLALSAGTHTIGLQMWSNLSVVNRVRADKSFFSVIRIRGGYVLPENVPQLSYNSASVVQAVAAPGALSTLRVTLNDGQRYKATSPLSADITASGEGGLDTGTEASSTWYNVFAVPSAIAGEFALVLSTALSSVGPTGFTAWKHLGWVRNDGSSNFLKFYQVGSTFYYAVSLNVLNSSGDDGSPVDLDISATIPPSAASSQIRLHVVSGQIQMFVVGETTSFGYVDDSVGADIATFWTPTPGTPKTIRYQGFSTPANKIIEINAWVDDELGDSAVQTQARFQPDTKSPKGTWQSGTTVDFAARPGQPSTVQLTLQDGTPRTFTGTLNWSDANGVADLGYDEAASQSGTDKWIYFYAVPNSGDDSLLTIRASDNPPSTGPTGYTNFKLVWVDYEAIGVLRQVTQVGNKFYDIITRNYLTRTSLGTLTETSQSVATEVPPTAGVLIGHVKGDSSAGQYNQIWISGSSGGGNYMHAQAVNGATDVRHVEVPLPTAQTVWVRVDQPVGAGNIPYAEWGAEGWVDEWIDADGGTGGSGSGGGGGTGATPHEQEFATTGLETPGATVTFGPLTATPRGGGTAATPSGYDVQVYRAGRKLRYAATLTTYDQFKYQPGTNEVDVLATGSAEEYEVVYGE